MPNTAPVKPAIIKWARGIHKLTQAGLAEKVNVHENQIAKWESGKTQPTLAQAETLARKLRIPYGYLFLSTPPPLEDPLPDLRTRRNRRPKRLSVNAREAVYGVLDIQDWYREYRLEYDQQKLPFVGKFRLTDDPKLIAQDIRSTLGIDVELRASIRTINAYVTAVGAQAESKGVLMMQSGIVGNNQSRPLSVDEFQGFVVADEIVPIIFINSRDYIAARIFTLAHELAHLWVGKSGIVNPNEGVTEQQRNLDLPDTERVCNVVATEILVPEAEFLSAYEGYEGSLNQLSAHFRVSRIVILRRSHELALITSDEFFARYYGLQRTMEKKKKKRKGGPPDYLFNVATRHSPTFTDSIIKDVRIGGTLVRDGASLLHMRTPTFSRMVESGEY